MEPCKEFEELYEKLSQYSDDIRKPGRSECFATGRIDGYLFRLFQEVESDAFTGDISELEPSDYTAWVGIKDEEADGPRWPAFYTPEEIEDWYNRKVKNMKSKSNKRNELRAKFKEETNIAPAFAEREPYISYIRWLETELLSKRINIEDLEEEMFKEFMGNFDCYADSDSEDVVPAMTRQEFMRTVKGIIKNMM